VVRSGLHIHERTHFLDWIYTAGSRTSFDEVTGQVNDDWSGL
jgi:hypothetical protein